MRAILVNPAPHGNGPYMRAAELAVRVGELLTVKGKGNHLFILPDLYGERQKRILKELFENRPDSDEIFQRIFLSQTFGDHLKKLTYSGGNYSERLRTIVLNQSKVQEKLIQDLERFEALSLTGEPKTFGLEDMLFEVNHNPIIHLGIPSYLTTIGLFSKMMDRTIQLRKNEDSLFRFINPILLASYRDIGQEIESQQKMLFIPQPTAFTYEDYKTTYNNEEESPPLIHPLKQYIGNVEKGIYVVLSGIKGARDILAKVVPQFTELGYTIYKSPFDKEAEGISADVSILTHKNIVASFARLGWSSVWEANMSGKPIITLPYSEGEDPEMYFNQITTKELCLGIVYNGQQGIIAQALDLIPGIEDYYSRLKERFGTLDGINYIAEKIAADQLKNENPFNQI